MQLSLNSEAILSTPSQHKQNYNKKQLINRLQSNHCILNNPTIFL